MPNGTIWRRNWHAGSPSHGRSSSSVGAKSTLRITSSGMSVTGARQARRVEVIDQDMDVLGGPLGRDVAGGGEQSADVEIRVVQGQGDRKGAVDAGIGHERNLVRHRSSLRALPPSASSIPSQLTQ